MNEYIDSVESEEQLSHEYDDCFDKYGRLWKEYKLLLGTLLSEHENIPFNEQCFKYESINLVHITTSENGLYKYMKSCISENNFNYIQLNKSLCIFVNENGKWQIDTDFKQLKKMILFVLNNFGDYVNSLTVQSEIDELIRERYENFNKPNYYMLQELLCNI